MTAFRTAVDTRRLRRVARDRFGWPRLRNNQIAAMRAVLTGRDTLAVLPTGAGKSAIYQVPAVLLPGPTVVVSPLLSLQADQIAGLDARRDPGLGAVRLSSLERREQRRAALSSVRAGRAEFVFVTPEQLADPGRLAEIRALRPSLVAVDEAHCVSVWGYDFRPDYLQLGHAIDELGRPPVTALTATASPPVREDIVTRLGLRDPQIVMASLDRPNLFIEAVHCPDDGYRWRRLVDRLRRSPMPGIVYVPTRREAEELAGRLGDELPGVDVYHGGLPTARRDRAHRAFADDEIQIMVATSAFGMGIDKPNIRWVNHVGLPESPDAFLQEIGRAGRDGRPAQALLLHRVEDVGLRRFFSSYRVDPAEAAAVAGALRSADRPVSRAELRERTGLGPHRLGRLITLLTEVGAAAPARGGRIRAPRYAPDPSAAAVAVGEQAERHQTVRRSRLEMMRHLADTDQCRSQALLAYFGEHAARACGHCDTCDAGTAAATPDLVDRPYPVHSTVRHAEWGSGLVLRYAGDQMTVLFDDVGYKTLAVSVVERNRLLSVERAGALAVETA